MSILHINDIVYYKLNENGISHYNEDQKLPRHLNDIQKTPYEIENKNGWIKDTLWSVMEIYGTKMHWGADCFITVIETEKPDDYE